MLRLEILRNFDQLPDDAILSSREALSIVPISERQLRRGQLLPRVRLSAQRWGYRVGHIRALARGGQR